MGFEVFLSCHVDGESSTFPIQIVESAFSEAINERRSLGTDSWVWQVEYPYDRPDNDPITTPVIVNGREFFPEYHDCSDIYIGGEEPDSSQTSSFMVDGPAANLQFYESLLTILQQTSTALYCAGDCPPLVGQERTIAHLPASMIEALGQPVLVRTAQEITDCLRG